MKTKPNQTLKVKVHNFVEDSKEKYQRTVFCRKCGQVAWFYDRNGDWNMDNPQKQIKECVEETR